MVEVKVFANGAVSSRTLEEAVFAHPEYGSRVLARTLKDAVVMYEANRRAGTHKTKTRSEVRGPNHKLWKQKHTGRARTGTDKSPLWRGGGVIFGPRPRDYSYHMPVQARRTALRNALLTKLRDGEAALADGWPTEKPSVKQATGILRALGMDRGVLVVTNGVDRTLYLSLRNVPYVDVCPVADLNAHNVLKSRYIVLTDAAYQALQATMSARGNVGRKKKAGG